MLPHLSSITIYGRASLADEHLANLALFPRLESLSLSYCYKVSEHGFQEVAELLPKLSRLELSFCRWLTDRSLGRLRNMPNLRSLCLRSSIGITDLALQQLSHLTSLTSLDLTFCYHLTDASLGCLRPLTRLQTLNISDCTNFSDAGLASLHTLTSLDSLMVEGCYALTYAGRVAARYAPHGLLQLHIWLQQQGPRSTPFPSTLARLRGHLQREHGRNALLLEIRSYQAYRRQPRSRGHPAGIQA
mmetsp:Transcript_5496/g.15300  ORF Transcript_5496/g.15300 Transcript_5496/m.15300 type:complete len:245 (+) Transcript_5496:970-1704(+)